MKRIFLLLLCMALFATPAFALNGEVVNPDELPMEMNNSLPSDWAGQEIADAQQAGLIPVLTGSPKFTDTITREQFAELVVCMVEKALGGELDTAGSAFSDSANPAVLKAYAAGIVAGVGDNLFDPTAKTNREQIATMIARAISYLEVRKDKEITPLESDISKFTDQAQVSGWAAEAVGTLAANGIMAGTSGSTLSPQSSCTLEQSILLLYRVFEKFQAAS